MNICFICNEYPPAPYGGIGNGTRILAKAAVRAGHRVRVLGVYRAQHASPSLELADGVEVHRIAAKRVDPYSVDARIRMFRTLAGWARRGEIDIVEVPDPEGWAAFWPKLPIPVVARVHGSIAYFAQEMNRPCPRTAFWAERASLQRANAWSAVSSYAEEKTREVFGLRRRGSVLYPAVELGEPADWAHRKAHRVVYAGTLTLKKGIGALIQSWPSVQRAFPDAELQVFGKDTPAETGPPMSQYLLSQIDAHSHGSIQFLGHAPRGALTEALRTARCAVYPSFAEAFAAAPMEAMAQGCPVVYSSRTSGRELIDSGIDGILIDPGHPEQIAQAIVTLLKNSDLSRRIGIAGRMKIQRHFTSDAVIEQLVRFYKLCISQFAPGRSVDSLICSSRS